MTLRKNRAAPKILQVINNMNAGGAEKLLLEMLPLYSAKNITVDVLLLDGKGSYFLNELESIDNINVYDLDSNIYNPFNLLKIMPFFNQYDLIHAHLFPSIYWVSLAKFISRSKVKLLITEHAVHNKRMNFWFFRVIDRFIYKRFDEIITISHDVDFAIKKHLNFSEEKFCLIFNGINTKNIYLSKSSQDKNLLDFIGSNGKLLVQVSRFQKQKDQKTVIKAMTLLPDYVKLILVGEGELRVECELLCEELKLTDRVIFLGIRKDVPQILKLSDIVVLSTRFEGLSLSSIEGLASGKPFIGSDSPGVSEVVKGAGILFPPGDYKLLAIYVKRLLSDEREYKKIAQSCVKRSKLYDIENMHKRHVDIYYKVLT